MKDTRPKRPGRSLLAVGLTLVITIAIVVTAVFLNRDRQVEEVAAHSNTPNTSVWQPNGGVNVVETNNDTRYIGGDFDYVGPYTGMSAQIDKTTAETDVHAADVTVNTGGIQVYRVLSDGSGGWFVGGEFTIVDDTTRNNLAHIQSDGTLDTGWNAGINSNGHVYDLILDGSDLIISGNFVTVDGESRSKVAKVSVTDGTVQAWNPPAFSNNPVKAIALDDDVSPTVIYVGGSFTTLNGNTHNRLAALDYSAATEVAWTPDVNNQVYDMIVAGSYLYVGGAFTTIDAASHGRLATYDISTPASPSLDASNTNANNIIWSLATNGTELYVGGQFTSIDGDAGIDRVGKFDISTTPEDPASVSTWTPNPTNIVRGIALDDTNNTLYIGGDFGTVDASSRRRVAALDVTAVATPYLTSWDASASSDVYTVDVTSTKVYLGGRFQLAGGETRDNIAAFDSNNDLTSWDPGLNGTGLVYSLAFSGSNVYIGGTFTTVGGSTHTRLVSVNDSTAAVVNASNFNINNTINRNCLVIDETNDILYVGGAFTSASGSTRNRVAAFDISTPASPSLTSWDPDASTQVQSLAISTDLASVYVGGQFTTIGGQSRSRLAEIDASTGLATSWDPGPNTTVYALHIRDGNIYVGGQFSTFFAGATSRKVVASFVESTGAIRTWDPDIDLSTSVRDISSRDGNQIFIAGIFSRVGGPSGVTQSNAVIVDSTDGTTIDEWNPGIVGGNAWSISVVNPLIYLGGNFDQLSNVHYFKYGQFATTLVQQITLTQTSDTLTRLKKSTAADHTIQFKQPTGMSTPGDEIFVTFPSDFTLPSVDFQDMDLAYSTNDGCDSPGSWNNVTLAATNAAGVWGASVSGLVITFTAPSDSISIAASKCIQIQVGTNADSGVDQIVNPSTAGVYQIDFQWGSNSEIGDTLVVILDEDTVTITANVAQTISFTISQTAIEFGTLSSSQVAYANTSGGSLGSEVSAHNFIISTNGTDGWVVTLFGPLPTNQSNDTIDSLGAGSIPSAGSEGYGIRAELSGVVGTAAVSSPYNSGTNYAYEATSTADEIATATAPTEAATFNIYYAATIHPQTESGTYINSAQYVATGKF